MKYFKDSVGCVNYEFETSDEFKHWFTEEIQPELDAGDPEHKQEVLISLLNYITDKVKSVAKQYLGKRKNFIEYVDNLAYKSLDADHFVLQTENIRPMQDVFDTLCKYV